MPAPLASAQQAEPPEPLTGDAAIDAWVRTTFGQPVDPETLDDPISRRFVARTCAVGADARFLEVARWRKRSNNWIGERS